MPSSICWPLFAADHFCADAIFCLRENVGRFLAPEQAALVHPGAEVGRDGDVGRGGDDAVGERRRRPWRGRAGSGRTRPGSIAPRPRARARPGLRSGRRSGCAFRGRCGSARSAPRRPARALSPMPSSGSHSSPSATPIASRSAAIWVGFIRPGVIVLVAGEGQAVALDRPGDEQGRDVVLRRVERLDQRVHAMAAEVAEQRRQRGIVMRLEEGRRRSCRGRLRSASASAAPP